MIAEKDSFTRVQTTFEKLLQEDDSLQERQQKLDEVRQCLQKIGTESSLITATVSTLIKPRKSRSSFEEVSAKAVSKVFEEHSLKLAEELVKMEELTEDGPVEEAEVLHDAMC